MREARIEDRFHEVEGRVCSVCGNPLMDWEQQERLGGPMCSYHADQFDKEMPAPDESQDSRDGPLPSMTM